MKALSLRHAHRAPAPAFALAFLALAASPAGATFHIAHIERLLSGVNGTTELQFVEIQMDAAGQNLVAGSKLIAFDAEGNFDHVVLTVPSKVESGSGRSFLMASEAFEAITGMAPDFVFDSGGGNGLPATDGMVCWGKPGDQTDPDDFDMVDCVSYGNYAGPPNDHTSVPIAVPPFGHGLERETSTGSSADDFVCKDLITPVTNLPDKRGIDATSVCTGCGNFAVEEAEECDDGDSDFVPGDFCSAGCAAFACGIPTSATATTPKTSDALFVLKAAVQTSNCDLLVCDVNGSGTVTTTDALFILRRAVGQSVELDCAA